MPAPRRTPALSWTLPALIPLWACSGPDKAAGDGAAPEDAVVWAGWNHTWERLSHRVSVAGATLQADGSFESGVVGGDWSDNDLDFPNYRLHATALRAEGLRVVHGDTAFTLAHGAPGADEASAAVPGADGYDHVIAVLRGFRIETDAPQGPDYPDDYDPALGYCSKGFAFAVGAAAVDGDEVRFPVTADARWGVAGADDPIDRSDMNGAIPYAQTAMTVSWTVVAFNGDLDEATGDGAVDQPHTGGAYSPQLDLDQSALGIELGTPSPGFPFLTSVDLAVSVPDEPDRGEYLRSYGVEVNAGPAISAEVTNSSLVETAPIRVAASVGVGWATLADGGATAEPVLATGSHDVGWFTVEP